MKPKVFQYIVLSLLLFFCTSACNDSDARENSNQPLPSTPEEGQVEEAGPFMRGLLMKKEESRLSTVCSGCLRVRLQYQVSGSVLLCQTVE